MLSRLTGSPDKIIEIGTHRGGSMLWLAYCFAPKEIICIDPMLGMSGPSEELLRAYAANQQMAEINLHVHSELVRAKAEDAAGDFEDGSADLVFIDGYHAEEFVTKDLEMYWPKVKPGGILCGHDYSNYHPDHLGVVRAVNKWEMEPKVTLLAPSRIFFIRKSA